MAKGLNNTKIEERNRNYEAQIKQRRNVYLFVIAICIFFSLSIVDSLLKGEGTYFQYMWFNPLRGTATDKYYFTKYFYLPIGMFVISAIIWLFNFGNPKRKYIKTLEKLKQKILLVIPFYFNGSDSINLYLRFGLKYSLENNFLKRKINQKDYLKKVKFLELFKGSLSPDKIFIIKNSNNKINLNIASRFLTKNDFFDLFKIIEGYMISNRDLAKNISLDKFSAIGSFGAVYSKESYEYFIHNYVSDTKVSKQIKNDFELLFEEKFNKKIQLKQFQLKQFQLKFLKIIENRVGLKGEKLYKSSLKKMVLFSPLAISEFLNIIYLDSKRYLQTIKTLDSKVYNEMNEYGKLNETKLLQLIVFVYFYKIINFYMGLPSGIITARLKDYDFQRVIDDIEHFEKSQGIRQVKNNNNDNNSKYNDIFARGFMVFYHNYTLNSRNAENIKRKLEVFNPLRNVDTQTNDISVDKIDLHNIGDYLSNLKAREDLSISEESWKKTISKPFHDKKDGED